MPGMDGLICLDQIRKRHPTVKVVVLSVSTDEKLIENVLKRGASAYIVKSVNPVDLPSSATPGGRGDCLQHDRAAGHHVGGRREGSGPDRPRGRDPRSPGTWALERAIAKELWVAEQTVKFHLTNVYRKLGVSNRTEATRYAYEQGLVDSPLYEHE